MMKRGLFLGLVGGAILSLVFIGGFMSGAAVDRRQVNSTFDVSDPDVQNFLSAYHLVQQRSYFRPFNKHRLLYAAIDGMLTATGDPHTVFLSPPENQQASSQLNGSKFSGIGALVNFTGHVLEIVAPVPGSPAEKAGLRPGDMVTRVDGVLVSSMKGNTAVDRIHGRTGTAVRLTVLRKHRTPFIVTVTRRQIAPITAYGRVLPGRLGYLQIFSFGDQTSKQVDDALRLLERSRVHGIVLDLRQNPGGYVDAAQRIVSDFLPNGNVAFEQRTDRQLSPLPVIAGRQLARQPIAILVDAGTASAAEITAAALREEGHAILLGTRTYGKGSMQSVYNLADGSTIRLTDRLWLTPLKHSINKVGLKPDIVVASRTDAAHPNVDLQLSAAEQYLVHQAR